MNRAFSLIICLCLTALVLAGCSTDSKEPTAEICWGLGFDEGLRWKELDSKKRMDLVAEQSERYKKAGITQETFDGCAAYFRRSVNDGFNAGRG